jgi:hypothetical protein
MLLSSTSPNAVSTTMTSSSPSYSKAIAKSMTIDEMRQLHQRALSEAEAKRTELRLVLASRYRELVGSSDEVLRMRERAQELHHLVHALPLLIHKLLLANDANYKGEQQQPAATAKDEEGGGEEEKEEGEGKMADDESTTIMPSSSSSSDHSMMTLLLRRELSRLPRVVHRALDQHDVFTAASSLVQLFQLIASQTSAYPLATALAMNAPPTTTATNTIISTTNNTTTTLLDPLLEAQMRMIFYHVQTLPAKTIRMARHTLLQSASYGSQQQQAHFNPNVGAWPSAAALSALLLLHVPTTTTTTITSAPSSGSTTDLITTTTMASNNNNKTRSAWWLDLYFDSKATLLQSLLQQLGNYDSNNNNNSTTNNTNATTTTTNNNTNTAEDILSKIVLILQYDIILHAYQIFCLRRLPQEQEQSQHPLHAMLLLLFQSLPLVDPDLVKAKSSRLLASYLPLIRNKVKSVLVTIAGTTASALGQIRQSLYDKTDGMECKQRLDRNDGICTWEQAVQGMVNVHTVLRSQDGVVGSSSSSSSVMTTTTTTTTVTPSGASSRTSEKLFIATEPTATATTMMMTTTTRKFSLWSALFSNTFSSLVHSLLTTSFHSVHAHVVSTLRTSVANAPPFTTLLPHEAYRNTLKICSDLNTALLKVSDDAHNLLVHAEEREESERRLRQSLYVQTCEIMGRLLNELRRMLQPPPPPTTTTGGGSSTSNSGASGAAAAAAAAANTTKQLIVGRLCHLLKFRLASLSTLLHPSCSPAALTIPPSSTSTRMTGSSASAASTANSTSSSGGMISWLELKSAFDLADDNDDGLITFDEAIEAVDSAFSGTPFHGAEMVRETLLLSSSSSSSSTVTTNDPDSSSSSSSTTPRTVTLEELALLSARGLRHDVNGPLSALGIIQTSLDAMVERCFHEWARVALTSATDGLASGFQDFAQTACTIPSETEWQRRYGWSTASSSSSTMEDAANVLAASEPLIGNVSPHAVGFLLELSSLLNRSVCPSDSLPPVPSTEYAVSLGISIHNSSSSSNNKASIPTMMETIRWSLLRQGLTGVVRVLDEEVVPPLTPEATNQERGSLAWKNSCPSALLQLHVDVSFFSLCFLERNCHGYYYPAGGASALSIASVDVAKERLAQVSDMVKSQAKSAAPNNVGPLDKVVADRHQHIMEVCDMFVSSLLGESSASTTGGALVAEHDWSAAAAAAATASMAGVPQLLLHNPLPSSRRFALLPVQADRSLADVIARGKFGKKEEESDQRTESVGGVMSSGLGFFSSMLKKK